MNQRNCLVDSIVIQIWFGHLFIPEARIDFLTIEYSVSPRIGNKAAFVSSEFYIQIFKK